ncbi:MAG: aldehyde dehydrogenase family protein [Candidatus Andeanibacterium colombiense]|uniref:Aldehyde dehydrogenase family protein n=1 Tax=Candidatus Andeanibacterium colombiense TaxID=3121345 RepID=A0AAJ6BQL3_9SPHN|nr:MAG: aldehyde dehydrogenase family protein [Sphingomonadaceae bacterium]
MSAIEVRDPRTGEVEFTFEPHSAEAVEQLCRKARKAQQAWREGGLGYRSEVMKKWVEALHARSGAIIDALAKDTGRRKISAEEVGAIEHMVHGYMDRAPAIFARIEKTSSSTATVDFEQQYVPYPVVGVIAPWNFPLVLAFFDALPALFAGCTVVLKPSEVTPRFIDPLLQSIADVPELDGVISVIKGGAETGQTLIANVDLIVFTGSIPTGRKIAAAAAGRMIPYFLELGGKDPAIVLAGSDLDRAATAIIRSAIYNSGQVCYAIERIYVEDAAHDELVRLLVEKCEALDLNYPEMDKGHIGPFIFRSQADIVKAQLDDAVAKGATIECGGEVRNLGGGLWMDATVVTGVTHDMRIMTEETFGPVIPVMRASSADEAVELANDTIFGLSAAVFAPDMETGTATAARVNAGGVSINDTELPRTITLDGEKMAFGYSGQGGSRYGASTMLRYVRKKALIRNHGAIKGLDALAEDIG